MKLWIYGDSNSMAFNLDQVELSWPMIVAQQLEFELTSRAKPGVDNFFIYQSWLEDLPYIDEKDLVVIGWTHHSRKMFLIDSTHLSYAPVINHSIVHEDHGRKFVRSRGSTTDKPEKYRNLVPRDSGLEYFDTWFRDYYNQYEQQVNLQSYIDSANSRCPQAIQFYFSLDSIDPLRIPEKTPLCIVDFILDNRLFISDSDCHASADGHAQWAKLILERINERNR